MITYCFVLTDQELYTWYIFKTVDTKVKFQTLLHSEGNVSLSDGVPLQQRCGWRHSNKTTTSFETIYLIIKT